ncbi:MAG: cupin domain-containing protein [Ignavibacteriales bacterium]|nr:cupin domain-containing protein [Ignavibacteriales bacterium]
MKLKNIFSELPDSNLEEIFESLLEKENIRIERIVSTGQSSPDGFWYEQEMNEWVILLKGSASILFESEEEERLLTTGDYIYIPAQVKHRVNWTDKNQETIWLAVHFR